MTLAAWLATATITAALVPALAIQHPKRRPAKPQSVHVFSSNLITVPSSSPLYEVKIMVRAGSAKHVLGGKLVATKQHVTTAILGGTTASSSKKVEEIQIFKRGCEVT